MRSLRLTLLTLVAGVLRRWLYAVTAQLAPTGDSPASPVAPADIQQPAPPDHWVELVRQHAPQLLDPEAPNQSGVIEWRSDKALVQAPAVTSMRRTRPLRLQTQQRPSAAPPVTTTAPRRPLRMEQVVAQSLDAEEISAQAARSDTREVQPPIRSTRPGVAPRVNVASPDVLEALVFPLHRPTDAPAQPIHEVSSLPDEAEAIHVQFANAPFERQTIRETGTSLPKAADVPTFRTRIAGSVPPRQTYGGTPQAPPQLVLRPTITPAPLSVEDVSADHWPSLPDELLESVRDSSSQQGRKHLRHEQKGRSWSE
jgi:hypothetical protein